MKLDPFWLSAKELWQINGKAYALTALHLTRAGQGCQRLPLKLSELRGAQRCRSAPNQRLYQNTRGANTSARGWSRYLSRVQAGGIASAGQMDGDTCDPNRVGAADFSAGGRHDFWPGCTWVETQVGK